MIYLRLKEILSDVSGLDAIPFERFKFPGGENHIRLSTGDTNFNQDVTIESDGNVMELLLATDALRRCGVVNIDLLLPYVPYARQDRVMVPGEPLSIKVYCDLINSQGFRKVFTLDNHSPVSTALINNVVEISSWRMLDILFYGGDNIALFCPDAGAAKRVGAIGRAYSYPVIQCEKVRNLKTGEITGTKVRCGDMSGIDCYIIDDICDGGRTFIEIAKVLKTKNPRSINLYVSHGIFSKNLNVFEGLIDFVNTTILFNTMIRRRVNLEIIPLKKSDIGAI